MSRKIWLKICGKPCNLVWLFDNGLWRELLVSLWSVILSQGFFSAITEKKAAKLFDLEGTHHKQKSILRSVVVVSCWPK